VGCSKESISVKASLIVSAWLASLTRLIGPCLIIDVGVASVSRFVVYLRYFEEITYVILFTTARLLRVLSVSKLQCSYASSLMARHSRLILR